MGKLPKELEPLLHEFRKIILEPQSYKPDGYIYHYTGYDGLYSILRSGAIRTTNVHCLNDPQEVDFGLNVCRGFLEDSYSIKSSHPVLRHALRYMMDGNAEVLAPSDYQFVASFSLKGDLLSQWRSYADEGAGYAIGFDPSLMLDRLISDGVSPNQGERPAYMLAYLIYDEHIQIRLLELLSNAAIEFVEDLEANGKIAKWSAWDLGAIVAQGIARTAIFFKSEFFHEEVEMRLLVVNTQELATTGARVGAQTNKGADGSLRVFRDVPLSDKSGLLPIGEIVIGPKADFERARIHLIAELESLGYAERMPRIEKSAGGLR